MELKFLNYALKTITLFSINYTFENKDNQVRASPVKLL